MHVVKAFAAEEHEQRKYAHKTQELREHYFQSERLQEINGAWMTLYFTCTLGVILWFGGWEVMHGQLTAGGLTQFILYMNQLSFPIRQAARIIDSISRAISSGERLFEYWMPGLRWPRKSMPKRWDGRKGTCALTKSRSRTTHASQR